MVKKNAFIAGLLILWRMDLNITNRDIYVKLVENNLCFVKILIIKNFIMITFLETNVKTTFYQV